jgi:hypothetical protein
LVECVGFYLVTRPVQKRPELKIFIKWLKAAL